MKRYYTRKQLFKIGFSKVGEDFEISINTNFYSVVGEIGNEVRIDALSIITGNIVLGDHCHISPFVFMSGVGGGIKLEEKVGIGSHSALYTKSEQYSNSPFNESGPKYCGPILIMKNTICGHGVTILPETTIGANCRIGAKCIVSGHIDEKQYLVSSAARNFPSIIRDHRLPDEYK